MASVAGRFLSFAILAISFVLSAVIGIAVAFVVLSLHVPESSLPWPRLEVELPKGDAAIQHVAQFVRFQTIARHGTPRHVGAHEEAFAEAIQFILDTYDPLLSSPDITVTQVNKYSLLLEWKGTNGSLRPAMMYGHYDVVPVSNETAPLWSHKPFSGEIHDGFIWGRGAMDMKSVLISMLEAWSKLHATGFKPVRTMLLGVGHDEEIGGEEGARRIAETLKECGTQLEVFVDEGTAVLSDGMLPLTSAPVAMIGTAEKGTATFKIRVDTPGGHSSMPPTDGFHTARVIADIITSIDSHPPPVKLQAPMSDFLHHLAPYVLFPFRGLLASARDWYGSLILGFVWSKLGRAPASQVRSTAVVTNFNAGVAWNVIPQHGELIVNMRLLQGQGGDAPLEYLKARIAATRWKKYVEVLRVETVEPSAVTAAHGQWWDKLVQAIQETIVPIDGNGDPIPGDLLVLPALVMGGTDSKHFGDLSVQGVYRFVPVCMNRTGGDVERVHGVDERIRLSAVNDAVKFYFRLVQLLSQA